jgi:hypothetical protein
MATAILSTSVPDVKREPSCVLAARQLLEALEVVAARARVVVAHRRRLVKTLGVLDGSLVADDARFLLDVLSRVIPGITCTLPLVAKEEGQQ